MVLYWLLHNVNCSGLRSGCKEKQQLVRSGNEPNADHHHREKHIMNLMKTTEISSLGQVTDSAFSPPRPEATYRSRSHSDILAHLTLSLASESLIASSPRLTLSTAVPTAFTTRPGLPVHLPSGLLATQILAHRSARTDLDRTTMLLLRSLRLSSPATLCAPQRQRDYLRVTTRAGTLSRLPSQRFHTQHALYVRQP